VRLPVVVIGGGLTAIDTATEALAYYPLQVEKFLAPLRDLTAERGAPRCAPAGMPPKAKPPMSSSPTPGDPGRT
jgi:NADPH-dependent glutamate synthase beta subunit-like oxidoreductase